MKKIKSFVNSYLYSILTNNRKRDYFMIVLGIFVILNGVATHYLRIEFSQFQHDIEAGYLFCTIVFLSIVFAIGFCMLFIQNSNKNGKL